MFIFYMVSFKIVWHKKDIWKKMLLNYKKTLQVKNIFDWRVIYKMLYVLIDWLIWMIWWLVDRFKWLIDWYRLILNDWLILWLIDWFYDWIDWLIEWLSIYFIDWLIHWLILIDLLISFDLLISLFTNN